MSTTSVQKTGKTSSLTKSLLYPISGILFICFCYFLLNHFEVFGKVKKAKKDKVKKDKQKREEGSNNNKSVPTGTSQKKEHSSNPPKISQGLEYQPPGFIKQGEENPALPSPKKQVKPQGGKEQRKESTDHSKEAEKKTQTSTQKQAESQVEKEQRKESTDHSKEAEKKTQTSTQKEMKGQATFNMPLLIDRLKKLHNLQVELGKKMKDRAFYTLLNPGSVNEKYAIYVEKTKKETINDIHRLNEEYMKLLDEIRKQTNDETEGNPLQLSISNYLGIQEEDKEFFRMEQPKKKIYTLFRFISNFPSMAMATDSHSNPKDVIIVNKSIEQIKYQFSNIIDSYEVQQKGSVTISGVNNRLKELWKGMIDRLFIPPSYIKLFNLDISVKLYSLLLKLRFYSILIALDDPNLFIE